MMLIFYALFAFIGLSTQRPQDFDPKTIEFGPAVSYSSSVLHQNPNNPDQHAQSSVKVEFNPSQTQSTQHYNSRKKAPRSNKFQSSNQHPIQTIASPQISYPTYQSQGIINQDSQPQNQLFNVGYSVSFTSGSKPARSTRQRLESAEIITGQRKDVVDRPDGEYDLKQSKISAGKSKRFKQADQKSGDQKQFVHNNLSPKTQQYFSYLGKSKPISSANPRIRQQLRSQNPQSTSTTPATWSNLSPSVEIYKSRDLPSTPKFNFPSQVEQSRSFDHQAALGGSIGFDFTNALGNQGTQKSVNYYDQTPNSLGFSNNQQYLGENTQNPKQVFVMIPKEHNGFGSLEGQASIKYPVDTTLLQTPNNHKNDPIPFDTSVLQAMQQQQFANKNPAPTQVQVIPSYQITNLPLRQETANTGRDHQAIQYKNQHRLQQNYGKNEFDQFFDRYLEKMQSQASHAESVTLRHPKTVASKRIRSSNYKLQTDLRPPPMKLRRRRMYNIYS